MNQIMPLMRSSKLKEHLEKIREWKLEGKTKEDVFNIMDRRVVTEEDVIQIYNEKDKEEEKINDSNLLEETENIIEENNKLVKEIEHDNSEIIPKEQEIDEEENNINFYLEEDFKENNNTENEEVVIKEQGDKDIRNEENTTSDLKEEYKELLDDELEDFPEQSTFKLYKEEKKQEMINSIRINGIIQPLIVRPLENGKYQILAGHNRRICGREAGLKYFPCLIKKGLTDEEAKLYFVDTNLATRDEITPIEKAKALLIRKNVYKSEKIKAKIENNIYEDNKDSTNVRKRIQEIEEMSAGNLQRYLRLNELDEDLQNLVEDKKISNLKVAEQLSYLSGKEQRIIGDMIKKDNLKISESQVKTLRAKEKLNKDIIREVLVNKKEKQTQIIVKFTEEEAMNYFQTTEISVIKEKIVILFDSKKEESNNV